MANGLPLFPLGTVLVPGLVLPLHIFEPRYRAMIRDLAELPEEQRIFGVVALRSAAVATDGHDDLDPLDDALDELDDLDDDLGEDDPGDDRLDDDGLDDDGLGVSDDDLAEALGDALGEALGAGDRADDGPRPAPLPTLYPVGCTAQIQEITMYDDGRADVVAVGLERFRLRRVVSSTLTPYLTADVELLGEPDGDEDPGYLAELVGLRFAAYRERLRVEQSGVPTDPRVLSYLVSAAAVLDLHERQQLLEAPTTVERLRLALTLLRREIGLLDAFAAMPAIDLIRQPVAPN